MSFIPRVHEIYKHFKGDLYQITAIAEHTETGEMLVVYQALYGEFKTYARPLSMFISRVDREKYPDVSQEFRFELQGAEAERQKRECGSASEEVQSIVPVEMNEQTADDANTECVKVEKREAEHVGAEGAATESEDEIQGLDPMLLEFLDSDSYVQKLNILAGLHHRITDEMITTMAIACDVEVADGDLEERYESLKMCLLTLERYECNRLR